jgi:hypothetical protein
VDPASSRPYFLNTATGQSVWHCPLVVSEFSFFRVIFLRFCFVILF